MATAGVDGAVHLFDVKQGANVASLTGHSKKVTGETAASGSRIVLRAAGRDLYEPLFTWVLMCRDSVGTV